MGHYRTSEAVVETPKLSMEREDIIRYQQDLSNYIAKFQIEKREAEYLLGEARNAQNEYLNVIKIQDEKINQLSQLVISLANKMENLTNGSGSVEVK